jgi:hypothetical protein
MRPRPEYESTSETAERTGLCTRTIRRRIADGTTTGYRVVGGRASPDELPEMPAAWIAGPTSSANGSSGYTDPDPDDLIENGIPVGVSQHDTLRDVVWKLRAQYAARSLARLVWDAIVAKTTLTRPDWRWTERDFAELWDSADTKIPPAPAVIDQRQNTHAETHGQAAHNHPQRDDDATRPLAVGRPDTARLSVAARRP